MANRSVIWAKEANLDIFEIMHYYTNRNKSKTYSNKLYFEIKQELKTFDFTISLPQKTKIEGLFYFTHKHISVFFIIQDNNIIVKFIIDDRRNPKSISKLIQGVN